MATNPQETVPLTPQDWADVAEAWAYSKGGKKLDDTSEEQLSRACTWISTTYPMLERYGFDPISHRLVLKEDGELVMTARRKS